MMNSANAVEIDALRVHRGKLDVLHELTVSVPEGQVVGLLGPSGSGKSTLMRSIVGAQKVADGTITVLGRPAGSASLRKHVGYVTQSPSVYDDLTVAGIAETLGISPGTVKRYLSDGLAKMAIALADDGTAADRLGPAGAAPTRATEGDRDAHRI